MAKTTQRFLELQRGERSGERNMLMARIAAVPWFQSIAHCTDPSSRVADALSEHIRLLGITPAPAHLNVLSRDEGLFMLRNDPSPCSRPFWDTHLVASFERACRALLAGKRVDHDPLFAVAGRSILMESTVLPVRQDMLLERLQDQRGYALSPPMAQALLDRVLWELGAMLAWETVGDLLGPNPFLPLLSIHEEGLVLLDVDRDRVLLWA
ncbi:MAG: hypothetical protein EXS14_02300 [Planctomycetes bacterium]|nr:hypothetical protein [Planctomycetota bacterium]